MFPDDSFLRKALLANGVFSGCSALVLLLAAGTVSRALGSVAPAILTVVGVLLALFSVDLVRQARSETLRPGRALAATAADLVWVAGSAVLLIARPPALSGSGALLVGLVAVVVLVMALLQLVGLRRFARNRRGETDLPSMFSLTRRADAPADVVWDRLAALDRIGEFYGELTAVAVEESGGRPVRTCVDREGRRWSEEVLTMDDDVRRLTLRFVTEADDFPFPVTSMVGGWRVTPRDGGSELTLWYEYALEGGLLGEVAAALLVPFLERRMTPVMRNLGRTAVSADASEVEGRVSA